MKTGNAAYFRGKTDLELYYSELITAEARMLCLRLLLFVAACGGVAVRHLLLLTLLGSSLQIE